MENLARQDISVIIINYNGEAVLGDCLTSLENQDYALKEIIVVDNNSLDKSREICRKFKVLFLGQPENLGLAKAYNIGAKHASGRLLFFINNDTYFKKDCVSRLIEAFDADDVFAADCLQYDWGGNRIIHGAVRLRRDFFSLNFCIPFVKYDVDWLPEHKVDVLWGCAGAFMIDKLKFESLGGFDNSFFLDYEDLDICTRAWMKGYRTVFVPSAIVYHRVSHDRAHCQRREGSFKIQFSTEKNAHAFVLKTMGFGEIFLNLCNRIFHIIVAILKGKLSLAWSIICSSWINLIQINYILEQRSSAFKEAKFSGRQVLKRFLDEY